MDRFSFKAKRGQRLVVDVHARRLIPYLADAVPGWFQATAALYDPQGKEVAYSDDFRFNPDPAIFYSVPANGEYVLEIRDSIYRGREDFVYRIRIGELPFITTAFPLGARIGTSAKMEISGWNLRKKRVTLDTAKGPTNKRWVATTYKSLPSNRVPYLLDTPPEVFETDENHTIANAQVVALPITVNGRIDAVGDVDVFKFVGKRGEEIVLRTYARQLDSPLDSLLRVTDVEGKVLAWNDDHAVRNTGLITHNSDSYVMFKLPVDGDYFVHLSDAQNHGGAAYAYRLRMGLAQPDFQLYVTPSGISVPAGKTVPIKATVIRRDGFTGGVSVHLTQSPGFTLSGGVIPKETDTVVMTLTAPRAPRAKPVTLSFKGTATVNGVNLTRTAIPAEDVMQAFLYRHLVESHSAQAIVSGVGRNLPTYTWATAKHLSVMPGKNIRLKVIPSRPIFNGKVEFELFNPPKGITLKVIEFHPKQVLLSVTVDASVTPGLTMNLIVRMTAEFKARGGKKPSTKKGKNAKKGKQKKKANKPWRVPLGTLPARPLAITK